MGWGGGVEAPCFDRGSFLTPVPPSCCRIRLVLVLKSVCFISSTHSLSEHTGTGGQGHVIKRPCLEERALWSAWVGVCVCCRCAAEGSFSVLELSWVHSPPPCFIFQRDRQHICSLTASVCVSAVILHPQRVSHLTGELSWRELSSVG